MIGNIMAAGNQQQQQQQQGAARPTSVLSNSSFQSTGGTNSKQHKLSKRFTVIRKLGKGTYGKVQLAINKQTGQEVAIKTIKKSKIDNEEDMQRVRREIQIMRSIEHPHIIHIYEEFENKDKIVLIMQYAPGGELYEYVSQSKALDDGEARRLFRQIATAIYYCHQNKICHRDLKLENILLDEKNNAKLADFGLSNVFDKQSQLKTFCGSPLYASPEIVQGSPYKGPEVDCWSLGVLLYTLVYGAMPFDGSNFKRLVKQISEASYFEPAEKSAASPLIRQLLCADPKKRATVVDICSDPWVNGAAGGPLISPGSPNSSHPSLLKVAKDMANLTPVRLDMLLALTLEEQAARQRRAAVAAAAPPRAPLVPLVDNKQAPRVSPPQQLNLDPSTIIMEVDEARAASPIASYIVRDHPEPVVDELPQKQKQQQEEEEEQEDIAEISIEQEPMVVVEDQLPETKEDKSEEKTTIEIIPAEMVPVGQHQAAPPDEQEEPQPPIEAADEPIEATEKVEEKPAVEPMCVEPEVAAVEQSAPKEEQENTGQDRSGQAAGDESGEAKKESEEGQPAAKPKKIVKKKVIVKKKKKISKKAADSADAQEEQTNEDKTADENQQDTGATKQVNKPGKVRIPNTFQATSEEAPSPATAAAATTRRPSALIVDVSQRLLQSASAEPKPIAPTIIESDQLQLKNVRVSDKKDELERRTSLAQAELLAAAATAAATRSQSVSPAVAAAAATVAEQQVEALQAKLVREMQFDECARADLTEVVRIEPRLTSQATLVALAAKDQLLQTPPADERSDSLETVKAADQQETNHRDSSVRSSMQIDLSPLQDVCADSNDDMWQQQTPTTASSGPAPIARSYKKVTFTRDGACITETGKIYSTQADDGTLRRVERKSKVTHYPAEPGSGGASNSTSRSKIQKEELFYGGGEGNNLKSRHLERLIMPSRAFSSHFTGGGDSDSEDEFFGGHSSSSRQQQRQQPEDQRRRDSASSCSSGSTDVLEDIFDTWTGAISMFNSAARPSSRLFGRAASKLSSGSLSNRRNHRRTTSTSSQTGTPTRCESVEPQLHAHQQQQQQQPSSSGYESDAAGGSHQRRSHQRRSRMGGAGPGSARGLFGSWNLLNDLDTEEDLFSVHRMSSRQHKPTAGRDLFGRDPFEILAQEQRSLRERLAQQHKQFWKGSIPSLFDDGFSMGESSRRPPPVIRDPRLPTGPRQNTQQQVGQSSSSSSFKVQQQQACRQTATPLEAAPIRRNTTNFSPIVQKSTSTTSSNQREAAARSEQQQQSTTFIELKRTSSSLGSAALARTSSKRQTAGCDSTSSSSIWNTRETPLAADLRSATTASEEASIQQQQQPEILLQEQRESPAPATTRDSIDRRVQSWLQESSGNLSATSSGSKSSQSISDSLSSSRRAQDPLENLYGSLWQASKASQHSSSSSRTKMFAELQSCLPPVSESGDARPILIQRKQQQQQQQLLKHSDSDGLVVSKQKQSIVESSDCSGNEQLMSKLIQRSQQCKESIISDDGLSMSKIATSRQSSSVVTTKHSSTSPQTLEPSSSASASSRWVKQKIEQASSRILTSTCGDELDEGQDLESRSSSSLLDQLKTKGYRSMINKRMVDESDSSAALRSSSSANRIIQETSEDGPATKIAMTTLVQESYSSHSSSVAHQKHGGNEDETQSPLNGSLEPQAVASEDQEVNSMIKELGDEQQENEQPVEQQRQQEVEDEDEDVREAKASIKCHLDRIKETELFLKSLKQDEENYERQRQQMILFNDLMLGPKHLMNGLKSSVDPAGDCSFYRDNTGLRSAPIRSYHCSTSEQENGFLSSVAAQVTPSAALSFEPTYVLPNHSPRISAQNYPPTFGPLPVNDPLLEPVQPVFSQYMPTMYHNSTAPSTDRSFRRSRSQLSDRFASSKRHSFNSRLHLVEPPINTMPTNEIYYPSRAKRSVSQMRYSSNRLSQPVAMSEYRSAYGNPHLDVGAVAGSPSPEPGARSASGGESDDGMSAYRVSSYVPRVVPTFQDHRGRSREKRRFYAAKSSEQQDEDRELPRQRKTSLQATYSSPSTTTNSTTANETDSPSGQRRRRSLTGGDISTVATANGEFSRLSELEQRIKENRRRREELLSGTKPVSPEPRSRAGQESQGSSPIRTAVHRRESSPAASPARPAAVGLLSRPSRLESMESRIKRKSYCVRVGDCSPERSQLLRGGGGQQMSLEKWKATRSADLNRRNETESTSSNLLLSSANRRASIFQLQPEDKGDEENNK